MPLHIPSNFMNLHIGYHCEGDLQTAYTSLGIQNGNDLDVPEQRTLAETLIGIWQDNFKDVTATEWTMTDSKVTLGSADPPYFTLDIPGTQDGTGESQAMPSNCAALISKISSTPGRPGRGRMFVPGLALNACNQNGFWNTGVRTAWQEAMNAFSVATLDEDGVEGIYLFHEADSPVVLPSFIFGLTVTPQIATQRRRMRP